MWQTIKEEAEAEKVNLLLVFGGRETLAQTDCFEDIQRDFPNADIVYSSTSGEILDSEIHNNSISVTGIQFKDTRLKAERVNIQTSGGRYQAGAQLAEALNAEDLRIILVFSEGKNVNGSELVCGLNDHLPTHIPVTGGLAGDGTNFQMTTTGLNERPAEDNVVAIGLYGDSLQVGFGYYGGWKAFGPYRKVTKSKGNVLYELDGKSALALYKSYLGDRAAELPTSGLLFPLAVCPEGKGDAPVRTLLDVNEEEQSLTFAGEIPLGSQVQLMKSNFDDLIDAAGIAAEKSVEKMGDFEAELAILISCVGRKLVLDQRVEEEVEEVRAVLGKNSCITGFYSYGEISPGGNLLSCELHNQTMTITTLAEK